MRPAAAKIFYALWLYPLAGLMLTGLSAAVRAESIIICQNFGCVKQSSVVISDVTAREILALFTPPAANAAAERDQIARAIARFEQNTGAQTTTHLDKAENPLFAEGVSLAKQDGNWPPLPNRAQKPSNEGQTDCIDETFNTTQYLYWLTQHSALRWHKLAFRAFRAPRTFDQHYAAQIEELGSGTRYVVDSWLTDNGQAPVIQDFANWRDGEPFSQSYGRR